MLNAMKVNLPYKGYDDTGRCECFVNKKQKKLSPWLNRLKHLRMEQIRKKPSLVRLMEVIREHEKVLGK